MKTLMKYVFFAFLVLISATALSCAIYPMNDENTVFPENSKLPVMNIGNVCYPYYDYQALTKQSDLIVIGTVVSVDESKWSTKDGKPPAGVKIVESVNEYGDKVYDYFAYREPDEVIYTDIVFSVSDVLKGKSNSDEIVIRSFGGTIGLFQMEDIFNPEDFIIGEKTMLYLVKDEGSIKDRGAEHYVVLPCGMLNQKDGIFVNAALNEEADIEYVMSLIPSGG